MDADLLALTRAIVAKRSEASIKSAAADIGIPAMLLARLESGRSPDLCAFAKIARWLRADPAVLLGLRPAPSILGPSTGAESKPLPALEADGDGYLTDEWLDALREHRFGANDAADFLTEILPLVPDFVSCCSVSMQVLSDLPGGRSASHVIFNTGGWSGAEELIGCLLDSFWIRHYHTAWSRGGRFEFQIPAASCS